jgi:phosphohistidine phosphatase SixA
MSAPTIYVMRHAEKPTDDKDSYLSTAGHARAEKLATWFPNEVAFPDHIFASTPTIHSQRPYQTVAPVAEKIGYLTNMRYLIDMRFADDEYDKLAELICHDPQYAGKIVVVCWHHGRIPHLTHALGAAPDEYPDRWDDKVFNLILKVEYCTKGNPRVTSIDMPF